MYRASSYNRYVQCIILQYVCTVHHPAICMYRASSYNMYVQCIFLQYVCTVHHPTVCMYSASSCNVYINQQDAKILVIRLYFLLDVLHVADCSRSNCISCTPHLVFAGTIRLAVVWL